jgi:uncharacterized protein YecE (DUF72 family)
LSEVFLSLAIAVKLINQNTARRIRRAHVLTDYLIGSGGWAYFNVPGKSPLKAYSQVFNFVEVNHTFYEYPDTRTVEKWRRAVPENFTFAVRCHQDLTHRIGLRPVDEAHAVLARMTTYCGILDAPFLVLETPASYILDSAQVDAARDFFASANVRGVRLVWEARAPMTSALAELVADLNIVHAVDLSREQPAVASDVVYSRLFGKGRHNIYQFTDEELVEIDQKALKTGARTIAMAYHGLRMNTDAARFKEYKHTGTWLPVTAFTGVDSAKAVLSEDTRFPATKEALVEVQGWKVIDLTKEKRIRLSEVLSRIPEKTYGSLSEVVQALEATQGSL